MNRHVLMMIVLGTLMMFGPISIDMYLPSMPTIAREFAVSDGSVQLTLSALVFGLRQDNLFMDRCRIVSAAGHRSCSAYFYTVWRAWGAQSRQTWRRWWCCAFYKVSAARRAVCWRGQLCATSTIATRARGYYRSYSW